MKKLLLVLVLFGLIAAAGFADEFYIRNETGGYTICYVYVSDSRSSDWGSDLLGNSVLRPGQSITITTTVPIGSTKWDIKVVDEDGDTYTIMSRTIRNRETITVTLADLD